jgi:hypothetical protein
MSAITETKNADSSNNVMNENLYALFKFSYSLSQTPNYF